MSSHISARSFGLLLSASISLMLLITTSVNAQDKSKDTSTPLQLKDVRIPTVAISPRDAASLPIPRSGSKSRRKFIDGPTPAPLSWADRTRILRAAGLSILPDRAPRSFQLSTRTPYIAGAGWLEFLKAYQTSPKDDYALFDASPTLDAFLWARLNLDRGRYLVDFNVRAFEATTFNIEVGERSVDIAVAAEGPQRLSVVVESNGSGVADVYLGARPGYIFRSMEIMRIDEGR